MFNDLDEELLISVTQRRPEQCVGRAIEDDLPKHFCGIGSKRSLRERDEQVIISLQS